MTHPALAIPSIADIRAAAGRIAGLARRTPLIRIETGGEPAELFLKLENLQPIGSFKIRGAGNAMRHADPASLARGVYTASAGNMAQGVAWCAREAGVPCRVIVPDRAPQAKLDAIARLGATAIKVPFDDWWQAMMHHGYPGMDGLFVHPFADPLVLAGNGTIALEIVEDLPDVDTVLVPYGGGGLSCGIAAGMRALRPSAVVWAVEPETATPFAASLAAGEPRGVEPRPSFVDGIGGKSMVAEMWPMARDLLEGSLVASIAGIEDAIRLLVARARVVAEGAGAAPVAAALEHRPKGRVVCVVSGGNIDPTRLAEILGAR